MRKQSAADKNNPVYSAFESTLISSIVSYNSFLSTCTFLSYKFKRKPLVIAYWM